MLNFKTDSYKYLLPNLLEIQRVSFCWFLVKYSAEEGIGYISRSDVVPKWRRLFSPENFLFCRNDILRMSKDVIEAKLKV